MRSDQDYIWKGIELADWYEIKDVSGYGLAAFNDYGRICYLDDIEQWFLDALAAQLIRQVDALEGCEVDSKKDETIVWDFRPGKNRQAGIAQNHKDRTMNNIKAIVDSGVLEKGDE